MAGDSVIGALRVDLGLNSAQFTAGLKQAQTGLSRFGDAAKVGLQLVTAAATAATVALGFAVKGAIDHADALSKAAQKAGVTVEALSRLEYAAKLSDISLESLTGSLGKLSKGMADAATDTQGKTASAFAALGVSVTDAGGRLKSSASVLGEIADKFSHFPDGVTKSALAIQIFGKAGIEMIPLLNEGSAGLARMAAESDKVGATISTKTAAAAERFNDKLTTIGQMMQGVINKIIGSDGFMDALNGLADAIADPRFAEAAQTLATNVANSLATIIEEIGKVRDRWHDMVNFIHHGVLTDILSRSGNMEDRTAQGHGAGIAGGALGPTLSTAPSTFDFGSFLNPRSSAGADDNTPKFRDLGKEAEDAAKKAGLLKSALNDIGPAGKTAADMASDSLRNLGQNAFGSLANLSGALSNLFKQNKAFAVATAVLQGLQGVAFALGSSAPPWNFINAAAVGIESAANVANILSTNENSTSMPTTSGGSAGQAAAAGQAGSAINLTFKGSGMFSVDDFVNQIAQGIADGGHQSLLKVIKAS